MDSPHRRLNLLTGDWVLVSPQRVRRPWGGLVDASVEPQAPAFDPACYLCPGNARAGGDRNPDYESTYVFDNDYPALTPEPTIGPEVSDPLLRSQAERGCCRVVCYSPRHDLTLAGLPPGDIRSVIDTWADQYARLGAIDWIDHVLIFENRGVAMGASNAHPHGQIWANERLPNETARELVQQGRYTAERETCLLCDYLRAELDDERRVVCADEYFVALVPFWAVWPFETLVLPRSHCGALTDLSALERDALAAMLRRLTRRYDQLFDVTFPYSMGWHQRPTDGARHPEWHLHTHFLPPLLRSATVRKFMVGYELLAQPQRDITPEQAARHLSEIGDVP